VGGGGRGSERGRGARGVAERRLTPAGSGAGRRSGPLVGPRVQARPDRGSGVGVRGGGSERRVGERVRRRGARCRVRGRRRVVEAPVVRAAVEGGRCGAEPAPTVRAGRVGGRRQRVGGVGAVAVVCAGVVGGRPGRGAAGGGGRGGAEPAPAGRAGRVGGRRQRVGGVGAVAVVCAGVVGGRPGSAQRVVVHARGGGGGTGQVVGGPVVCAGVVGG